MRNWLARLFALALLIYAGTPDLNAQASCNSFYQYTLGQCPTVSFFDGSTTSSGTIIGWTWDFGDGGSSTQQNPQHTYAANGVYQVCLVAQTSSGCVSTYCDTIPITCIQQQNCQASFQYNQCPNVYFTDLSTTNWGPIINWTWDFGDGGSSSMQYPQHNYTANGNYLVCLTIQTSQGCISTHCDTITIGCIQPQTCHAAFGYNTQQCPTVAFNDTSYTNSGNIVGWSWNFGDGGTSSQQSPQHTYTANGSYAVCLTIQTSTGCTNTLCDTITISCIQQQTCQAVFQYSTSQCPTVAFQEFSTTSSGTIFSYAWDFGDGGSSGMQNPTHTYTANGTYVVCLTIQSSNLCYDTYCDTITIGCIQPQTCQAVFQYTQCPNVFFFDASTSNAGTITGWTWDFGDGGSSTQQNPQHTYTANGWYQVCLVIQTSGGCFSTYCDSVNVSCIQPQTCNADFMYSSQQCPNIVFFDSSSTNAGNIINWIWDFGDGGNATIPNPQHTYTANGNYLVCLTIQTSQGCTDTYCDTITIGCIQPQTCQASYQYTMAQCPTIAFFDGSTTNVGSIVGWTWDFGDGGSSTQQNPQHTYSANGTYVVCLIAQSSSGCFSTYCDSVNVSCIQPQTCNADFMYSSQQCPNIVFFDSSSTNAGNIINWIWDFGDGGNATIPNPQHTYTANGNYLVCLTITTTQGCTDTYCDTITIGCIQPQTCQASYQYTMAQCPTIAFFDGSTTNVGSIVGWTWDFGDGGSSTQQNPQHTYSANGTYVVCLIAQSSSGCFSTYCDTINISCIQPATCNADFLFSYQQCPNIVFFDSSSTNAGNIINWIWDFGDGGNATIPNPQHTYTANGNYLVCLTITTTQGCTDTYCDTITIGCIQPQTCHAAFGYNTQQCPTVAFNDTSYTNSGNIIGWSWNFGDGGTSTQQSPQHTYTANGSYAVCLTIQTSTGCTNTVCDTINISCIQSQNCQAMYQYTMAQCPTIAFFDGSTTNWGPIINWVWDFGDGSGATTPNPQHTYTANGTYVACLTIQTSQGCTSTYCDTINIACIQPATCNADFLFSYQQCPNIAFFDSSSTNVGSIVGWSWNFGDGGTSGLQNPQHAYTANGNYLVCLTIQTSAGCTDTYCDTITIGCIQPQTCQASYQYTMAQCPTIAFFDGSTTNVGSIVGWTWDFGDGGSSTQQNPQHTYTANGTYVVCLIAQSSGGCVSTYCDTINITCIQPQTCQAFFQFTMPQCPTVAFYDASTTNLGSVVSWSWSFGDGSTSSTQNPQHTYAANGNYQVCLVIQTSGGCVNTYCDTINITCIQPQTCQANFGYTQCPDVYFFDASTSNAGSIVGWTWDFGDGGSSTMQNPQHTYTANGWYQVCLIIQTSGGCFSTYCDSVNINCIQPSNCNAAFTQTSNPNLLTTFTDVSTSSAGPIVSWIWDFGDGGNSTQQNPTHVYANAGWYQVCLTIITGGAQPCTSVTCDSILVGTVALEEALPFTDIRVTPNPFGDNFTVSYTLTDREDVELVLYDALGKKVRVLDVASRGIGTHQLSVSAADLSAGLYLLRLSSPAGSKTLHILHR